MSSNPNAHKPHIIKGVFQRPIPNQISRSTLQHKTLESAPLNLVKPSPFQRPFQQNLFQVQNSPHWRAFRIPAYSRSISSQQGWFDSRWTVQLKIIFFQRKVLKTFTYHRELDGKVQLDTLGANRRLTPRWNGRYNRIMGYITELCTMHYVF